MTGFRTIWQRLIYDIVDQELAAKLESELGLERDIRDSELLPANVQDFLDNSPFTVSYDSSHKLQGAYL